MKIKRFLRNGFATWKDHPEYPGLYQVSVNGEVRGIPEKEIVSISKSRKPGPGFVRMYYGGLCTDKPVDHLVLEAFVGPCPSGMECVHADGDVLNSCVDNLSWGEKIA